MRPFFFWDIVTIYFGTGNMHASLWLPLYAWVCIQTSVLEFYVTTNEWRNTSVPTNLERHSACVWVCLLCPYVFSSLRQHQIVVCSLTSLRVGRTTRHVCLSLARTSLVLSLCTHSPIHWHVFVLRINLIIYDVRRTLAKQENKKVPNVG